MPYDFKPVGHEAPENVRAYEKVDDSLAQAFEKWLEDYNIGHLETDYKKAVEMTEGLAPAIGEAH